MGHPVALASLKLVAVNTKDGRSEESESQQTLLYFPARPAGTRVEVIGMQPSAGWLGEPGAGRTMAPVWL